MPARQSATTAAGITTTASSGKSCPLRAGQPQGALAQAIEAAFGSFEVFEQTFSDTAAPRFGSGWAWLGFRDGHLNVLSMPDQDAPVMAGMTSILGLDV